MGEYLVRCFPSYPTKEAALEAAIKQIGLTRQGKPQNVNASGEQRRAAAVWGSNLTMSQYFPPLPEHIQQQRKQEHLAMYARHLSRDTFDPYRDIPELPMGGRKVGD